MRSEAIYSGRNFDRELDDYIRCARCGFICRLSRDPRSTDGSRSGWGINYTVEDNSSIDYDQREVNYDAIDAVVNGVAVTPSNIREYDYAGMVYDSSYVAYDNFNANDGSLSYDSVKRIYDPVVSSGCPQCGTLLYKGGA